MLRGPRTSTRRSLSAPARLNHTARPPRGRVQLPLFSNERPLGWRPSPQTPMPTAVQDRFLAHCDLVHAAPRGYPYLEPVQLSIFVIAATLSR